MKVLFMGTPDFALPCLCALTEKHDVTAVVTREDKKKGRKMVLTKTPVKIFAEERGIPVFTPKSLKNGELMPVLEQLKPEVIVVVAYGLILPKEVLDFPKYGCINVHGSLLPKYRGAAPMQWSIINGEEKTGVTIMYMDEGLDTGDMLKKAEIIIDNDMNFGKLHDIMSELGAKALIDTLSEIENNTMVREKQDDSQSSYSPMINKAVARLDFSQSSQDVRNKVRGLYPVPSAYCYYNDKTLKILSCSLCEGKGKIGEIIATDKDSFTVACKCGAIRVTEIQLEGKKKMSVNEFFKGNSLNLGTILI